MRLASTAVAAATLAGLTLMGGAANAQNKPAAAPAPAAAAGPAQADPLLAKVNGQEIHLSDLNVLANQLPPEARQLPPQQLLPQLLDQAIDGRALVLEAKKEKIDQDPIVSKLMAAASDRALQTALIQKDVGPTLDEAKIRAKYDAQYAGKPGEEEVHARHILVKTEAEAKDIIAKLKGGADFAALAKEKSTDPAAASGGDLGFFKSGDMLPEFSAVAFSLKPGQYSDKPVQTRYGWHVVKVEERRTAPAPTYEAVHDELRQQMIQDGITKTVMAARAQVKVERFNPDGSLVATPAPAKP